MSCYVIEIKNIKKIVLTFRRHAAEQKQTLLLIPGEAESSDITEIATLNRIGQALVDQNYRSFNYRYQEQHDAELFILTGQDMMHMPRFSTIEQLKALDSYDYQASETNDYKETPASLLVNMMRRLAIRALPGYDEATWI